MAERQPIMTQTMTLSEARQHFSQVLTQVYRGETRVLVEKSGIPVAGIISVRDLERLTELERQHQERFKILDEIGAAFRDTSPEEIEREVSQALAEVRAEARREGERTASQP